MGNKELVYHIVRQLSEDSRLWNFMLIKKKKRKRKCEWRKNSYDTYCIFKNYSIMQTKIINEYRVSFFWFLNMVVTVYLFQSLIKSKVFPQMHKDVNDELYALEIIT